MAKDGLRFTRFYAGASLCLPSRCTLMTGLHTGHCRCRTNGGGGKHPPIQEQDTTLAAVLKAAGYRTGMTGKWALGDDYLGCVVDPQNIDGPGALYKHGWDYYFGEPNQPYNHRYLFFTASDKNKKYYVVRGPNEKRSDEEIFTEANTKVVVPEFGGKPVAP